MSYCASCGTQISGSFCSNCGQSKATNQETKGSSKAMWVHLAPLLLSLLSYLIFQTSVFDLGNTLDYGYQGSDPNSVMDNPFAVWWFVGKVFAVLPLLVLWLYPVIVRMSSKSSTFEKSHATASLNFQISLFLYISAIILIALVATAGTFSISIGGVFSTILLWLITFGALGVVGISSFIFYIMASVAGKRGTAYRYPLAINFLK
jgi:uncharacterized Tic20 family protein